MCEQIMTFYFDYLCMERFAKEADNLLCVGGAMTFLLKQLAGQLLYLHMEQPKCHCTHWQCDA